MTNLTEPRTVTFADAQPGEFEYLNERYVKVSERATGWGNAVRVGNGVVLPFDPAAQVKQAAWGEA